jgi:hypothetical protein
MRRHCSAFSRRFAPARTSMTAFGHSRGTLRQWSRHVRFAFKCASTQCRELAGCQTRTLHPAEVLLMALPRLAVSGGANGGDMEPEQDHDSPDS